MSDTLDRKLNGLRPRKRLSLNEAAYFVQAHFSTQGWDDAVKIIVERVEMNELPADIKMAIDWSGDIPVENIDPQVSTVATSDLLTWLEPSLDPVQTNSTGKWPWGDHETELLRQLADAAKKFWINYDSTDPSTAPTNKQVKNWLKDQGVADRTADIMASILRADGLPTGPRK